MVPPLFFVANYLAQQTGWQFYMIFHPSGTVHLGFVKVDP